MITRKRKLRTGVPVWADEPTPPVASGPLKGRLETDIAVIGAGVSGAMIAEALAAMGLDVAVLDRRPPLSGSTAASTALLQYEIDEPLTLLSARIGEDKAASAWRRSRLGVESLAVKIRQLGIDCQLERRNSLYLAGNKLDPRALERESAARNAIGLHGDVLSRRDLRDDYGINGAAALKSWDNLAVNPVQMAAGFLNAAAAAGARIHSPVEITAITRRPGRGGGYRLAGTKGEIVEARFVVFATGYEFPDFVPHERHTIHSTWALSTEPVKTLPRGFPFIWQAADPYFYGRTTSGRHMIFGGEDEEFSDPARRDALTDKKIATLEKKLRRVLPDHDFKTRHVWSGSFGSSTTGLPTMGPLPGRPGCYVVMAYGGNGITFSRIAAELVAADIGGYRDPDAALFGFRR